MKLACSFAEALLPALALSLLVSFGHSGIPKHSFILALNVNPKTE